MTAGVRTDPRRYQSADAGRSGSLGAGLAPAGEDLHRDQAPGPVRLAGGEQGAGPAAPLRHRLARLRRPVSRGGDVVLRGRGVADPASRAAAADGAARQDRPLPDQQRGDRRRGHRRRALAVDAEGISRNSSTAPSPRAGRCTAGTSTNTRTSSSAGTSGCAWIATNHPGRTKAWLQNATHLPSSS